MGPVRLCPALRIYENNSCTGCKEISCGPILLSRQGILFSRRITLYTVLICYKMTGCDRLFPGRKQAFQLLRAQRRSSFPFKLLSFKKPSIFPAAPVSFQQFFRFCFPRLFLLCQTWIPHCRTPGLIPKPVSSSLSAAFSHFSRGSSALCTENFFSGFPSFL